MFHSIYVSKVSVIVLLRRYVVTYVVRWSLFGYSQCMGLKSWIIDSASMTKDWKTSRNHVFYEHDGRGIIVLERLFFSSKKQKKSGICEVNTHDNDDESNRVNISASPLISRIACNGMNDGQEAFAINDNFDANADAERTSKSSFLSNNNSFLFLRIYN